jgi:hypothetical protein
VSGPFATTSSPVQTPTGDLAALTEEGPLHFTARALQAQLQRVFPANRFDWHWLDGKLTAKQWGRLTRRTPAVGLGWAGVTPNTRNSLGFFGASHWFLALVTRNEMSAEARLLGDKVAPGILSMVRAATIALNGYTVDPPDTPWQASGSTVITGVGAFYSDDWTDEASTLAGVDISVEYEEVLPASLNTPNAMNALQIAWGFPAQAQWTDLATFGASS